MLSIHVIYSGIVLCLCLANERWRYIITSFLIDLAHTQSPCMFLKLPQYIWRIFRKDIEISGKISLGISNNLKSCFGWRLAADEIMCFQSYHYLIVALWRHNTTYVWVNIGSDNDLTVPNHYLNQYSIKIIGCMVFNFTEYAQHQICWQNIYLRLSF